MYLLYFLCQMYSMFPYNSSVLYMYSFLHLLYAV